MKIAYNETLTLVILHGGRLKLYPKGSRGETDRRQISDEVAEEADVKRFKQKGLITIRSLEEAAQYEASLKQNVATIKANVAVKAAAVAQKAAAEAKKAQVTLPQPPPEKPAEPPPAEKPAEKPAELPPAKKPAEEEEAPDEPGDKPRKRSRH